MQKGSFEEVGMGIQGSEMPVALALTSAGLDRCQRSNGEGEVWVWNMEALGATLLLSTVWVADSQHLTVFASMKSLRFRV
jgi:hypothetical protein